ncbi:E3 binding domain-containing protein [Deefgea rivuli]|uniref:E3 binding domain-containing protein n=1 Tax=Deefgea rivuli TaxID=400948 RepID=UPI000482C594|nr:E3 binding domain-containing protein [Deefgea rivuli]
MNKNYTTHLICAPELTHSVVASVFHVKPGQIVAQDELLLTLEYQGQSWPIHAPERGEVSRFVIALGEAAHSGDLLLMMEVEEIPTGFLLAENEEPVSYHITAPPQAASSALKITPAAAKLAARLGVDLSEIKANGLTGEIGESEVELHVREVLLRWQQLKQWVNT